jgi:DNA recombination protein RmuC
MEGSSFALLVLGALAGASAAWGFAARRASRIAERAARLEAELEAERRLASERLSAYEKAESKLRESFQALSAEALRDNNRTFLEIARAAFEEAQKRAAEDLSARQKAIGELLDPVEKALKLVDEKIHALEKEREGAYRALREQVASLAGAEEKLRTETANLVQALRAPSVRGRWGEIHLRRLVELAGMVEHCDFEEQATVETEQGRLRPDLVVRLPGGKRILVDAKVPLKAYLEAQELAEESSRRAKLEEHARAVRDHIGRLGSKAYADQFEDTPDFVVLFIPGEAFFAAAVEKDPELIEYGFSRRVVPASPTTLLPLLKTVYLVWQQERLAESARAIRDLGTELHERLRTMSEHLAQLGEHLRRAVEAYDQTVGSFERRVLVAARRLRDLGVGNRDLPELAPIDRSPRPVRERDVAPTALEQQRED